MSRASAQAIPKLEARLYEASECVSAGDRDRSVQGDVQKIVAKAVRKAFSTTVAVAMRDVMEHVDQADLKAGNWKVPSIDVLTEEVEVSQSTVAGGTGKALGGTAGGLLGLFFGPIGAIVGGVVGGFVGGKIGEGVAGTKTIETEVGTNVEEAISKLLTQVDERLEPLVSENLEAVAADYFAPLEEALKTTEQNLREAEDDLLALRYDLDK
jgi:uncharacterized membrane protein